MTNEDAIAIIENEKRCVNRADHCNRDCYNCELVKTDTEILTALNMAIEALKQEPYEDCISRQAVNELQKYRYNCGDTSITCVSLNNINELPSVTPKQKIGHWIFHKSLDKGHKNCNECIECSQCHSWYGYDYYIKTPYCPNCGLRMTNSEV